MAKFLVRVPIGAAPPAGVDRQRGVTGWIIDEIQGDQALLELQGLTPPSPAWSALHWIFCEDGTEPELAPGLSAITLAHHVGWDYERSWPDGAPTPGIKQVSFLHKGRGVSDDDFRQRYRAHVGEARRHMPGLWKYVQNLVDPLPSDRAELFGVSELWFASVDDFRDRYWATPESQIEEHAEVSTFLSSRTWSMIVHEVIQPCGPASAAP
jgi:hypothetical protein